MQKWIWIKWKHVEKSAEKSSQQFLDLLETESEWDVDEQYLEKVKKRMNAQRTTDYTNSINNNNKNNNISHNLNAYRLIVVNEHLPITCTVIMYPILIGSAAFFSCITTASSSRQKRRFVRTQFLFHLTIVYIRGHSRFMLSSGEKNASFFLFAALYSPYTMT